MTLRVHVWWVVGRMILRAVLLCFPVNGSVRLLGELSWSLLLSDLKLHIHTALLTSELTSALCLAEDKV